MNVNGNVALITGGGSGLGRAVAERLHSDGATVVIVGRSPTTGKAVADQLGERAVFVSADVTDEVQVNAALDLAAELGELRVVVNCAGLLNATKVVGRTELFPLAEFARVVQVNLVGTFNVVRLAAARIAATEPVGEERGVLVNTASIAAFDGQIGQAAYGAAKGGVVAMTLPVAREMARHKIRVNTIAPGLFDTPMLDPVPADLRHHLAELTPHPGRLGRPAEFADLVAHIIANPMVNGETIRLDGGIRMPAR